MSRRRSVIHLKRLNDYLEVPGYSFSGPSTGGVRCAASGGGGGGISSPVVSGGTGMSQAFASQGFKADISGGSYFANSNDSDGKSALEPMHVRTNY